MYELDAPDISVQHNITVKDLFRLFFNNLGLVEHKDYLIDETLSSTIKMAWFESGTVGDCIKSLSTSCACLVYVNRHNQIVVKDQLKLSSYDVVLSDNDQIYDIRNVPSYQEMRSVVELEYNIPSVDNSPTELLSITDLTLQPGLNEFKKLEFSKSPVALISGIQINKGSAVIITDYTINAHSIDITIQNNRGQEQTVDISIFGNVINSTKSSIIKKDLELLDVVGNRPLKLNSYLLQSNNTSQEYVDVLLSLVTNFGSNIEMEVRGNPLIEITDVINISAPSYNIVEKVRPIKVTYSMREGLSGTMLCVKSDSRSHSDTVFISPGLIVTSNR